MAERYIYADNSATTRPREECVEAMRPYLAEVYGNPSSAYSFSSAARRALDSARRDVADALGAFPDEICFTSGGTEADNHAIFGAAGGGLAVSAVEHPAVYSCAKRLEREGARVRFIPSDGVGLVSADSAARCADGASLVSVIAAQNEVGTLEPLAELAEAAHSRGALFHTDAVQAVGHVPIDVHKLEIDLLSLSAHKFGGPRGVGALYIRRGVKLRNLIEGGGQESGRRSGTENVAGAVGMAAALAASVRALPEEAARLNALGSRLFKLLLAIPGAKPTGPLSGRLPGHVSVTLDGAEGEALALLADLYGAAVSTGSACSSGRSEPSRVLLALGIPPARALGSLRLTLGRDNTEADVDALASIVGRAAEKLRGLSPS